MNKCSRCEDPLPSDGVYAICSADRVNCKYHFHCTTIKQRTYQQWGASQREKWICVKHRELKKIAEKLDKDGPGSGNSSQNSDSEEETSKKISSEIKVTDFETLTKYLDRKFEKQEEVFLETLDRQVNRIEQLERENLKLQEENKELKKEVKELWVATEKTEIELRQKNLIIRGIPEEEEEKLEDVVSDIAHCLEEPINRSEIDTVFRLPNRSNSTPRPILVRLTTTSKRDKLVSKSWKKKPTLKNIWENESEDHPVFISEHLTTKSAEVVRKCTDLKKKGFIELFRIKRGLIHVKGKNSNDFKVIRDVNEIEELLRIPKNQVS
uniref:Uncharacterized protein n=1 Tax=Lygus hesperus TaxID=30085 RepID=A0A0A9XMS4_LYGHE